MAEGDDARRGLLLALAAYGLWGVLPLYWKLVESIDALEVTAARVVLTGATTWLLLARGAGLASLRRRVDGPTIRLHAVTAALLGINWVTYVWAVNDDRVVETSLGYFINPLVNVVLGVAALGERLAVRQWLAVGLATIGVGILTVDAGTVPWVALVLAGSFGLYGLRRKTSPLGSLDGLGVDMVWLAVPAAAVLAWFTASGRSAVGDDAVATGSLLVAGLATAVPLLAFAGAARRIPLSALGLMQYVAPTLQFGIGVLAFDEPVGGVKLLGFGVVWAALVVFAADSVRSSVRQRPPSEPVPLPVADPPPGPTTVG